MPTDQVHIRDLRVRTIIGVNPDERTRQQEIVLNITLYTDHSAAVSDDIADVIDYSTLNKKVIALVEGSQFFLIEKLALAVTELCMSDERVSRAIVTVDKPGVVRYTRSVAVTVDRSRA